MNKAKQETENREKMKKSREDLTVSCGDKRVTNCYPRNGRSCAAAVNLVRAHASTDKDGP